MPWVLYLWCVGLLRFFICLSIIKAEMTSGDFACCLLYFRHDFDVDIRAYKQTLYHLHLFTTFTLSTFPLPLSSEGLILDSSKNSASITTEHQSAVWVRFVYYWFSDRVCLFKKTRNDVIKWNWGTWRGFGSLTGEDVVLEISRNVIEVLSSTNSPLISMNINSKWSKCIVVKFPSQAATSRQR